MKKTFFLLPLLFINFLLKPSYSSAQTSNTEDLIIFSSPDAAFLDIVLQKHGDLPRMGDINRYSAPSIKNGLKVKVKRDPALLEKSKNVNMGYQNFTKIIGLKYLADHVARMDTERPVELSSSYSKEQSKAMLAQKYLQGFMRTICATEDCKNAFNGANEFERMRNYRQFIGEQLPKLMAWSKTFLTNDAMVFQQVSTSYLGAYDFDKKGFWLQLTLNGSFSSIRGTGVRITTTLDPKVPYETELWNKRSPRPPNNISLNLFIPMSMDKAEEFQKNNLRTIFVVRKIKVMFKEVEEQKYGPAINFTYHHETPEMEVYEDVALTKKIGVLSLDKLFLK